METSLQQNNSSQAGHLEKKSLDESLMAKGQHQEQNLCK